MPDTTDLRRQAQETFTHLANTFRQSHNMWRLGHSFDTAIDYLTLFAAEAQEAQGPDQSKARTDAADLAQAFAQDALRAWRPLDGAWFDDYAWWGIAALRASLAAPFPDNTLFSFKRIAQSMWGIMDGNAPWVWDNELNKEAMAMYRPRFEGGVWNSNWPDSRWEAGFFHDPGGLVGIQNTVTNGLYLVLSTRLYRAGGTRPTRDAADREWRFLSDWFDVGDADKSLLSRFDSGAVLVRERVSTYANGEWVGGYDKDTFWAGDQGLILGGLVDRMAMRDPEAPERGELLELAKRILQGVHEQMVEKGVLQPWISADGSAPGGDPGDYTTGIGVFMRYLLYAFNNCAELRDTIRTLGFGDVAVSNGQAQPFPDPSTDGFTEQMTLLANKLALLVTGIVLTEAA